jgi:rhamnosyltransferase
MAGEWLTIVRDDAARLGPTRSFFRLLGVARADIYMFCDQDDIWMPQKVVRAVTTLRARGLDQPLLYHTDLTVTDERLETRAASFHRHEGVKLPAAQQVRRLAVQNCVVGCTMAVTDALVRRSKLRDGCPAGVAMHDWWLALLAACVGQIIYSPQSDILYRQHVANVSGTRRRSRWQQSRSQFSRPGVKRIIDYKSRIAVQAHAFMPFYEGALPAFAVADLQAVARLIGAGDLPALWGCVRRGIWLQNLHMNVAILYSTAVARVLRIGTGQPAASAVGAS